jgi:probable rRNA maturation factor
MIRITVFNAHPKYKRKHAGIMELLHRVFKNESIRAAAVNIIFVDDSRMIDLNKYYLRHNYPTDVLSFPLSDDKHALEGEVYVNLDQARRQAHGLGLMLKEEASRLVIHGALHLLGYDDSTAHDKKRMTQKEDHYLFSEK